MRLQILALTIALSSAASAQTPGTQLSDFQAQGRERLLEADANKDGRLSKAEWAARADGHPGRFCCNS